MIYVGCSAKKIFRKYVEPPFQYLHLCHESFSIEYSQILLPAKYKWVYVEMKGRELTSHKVTSQIGEIIVVGNRLC